MYNIKKMRNFSIECKAFLEIKTQGRFQDHDLAVNYFVQECYYC